MSDYQKQVEAEYLEKIQALTPRLPAFWDDYYIARKGRRSIRTMLAYASDLSLFCEYITESVPELQGKNPSSLDAGDFAAVKKRDIELYMDYITKYEHDGKEVTNCAASRNRKLTTIKSVYKWLLSEEQIEKNPAEFVETAKLGKRAPDAYDPGEVATIISEAYTGDGLSDRMKAHHDNYAVRDHAIMMVLFGTGMRVSELVGLNISDLDERNMYFIVHRKGGNEEAVYASQEVIDAVKAYMHERNNLLAKKGIKTDALFLSSRVKRISVDSVEILMKKYAGSSLGASKGRKAHPHQARASFATNLLSETGGDLHLVSKALGHASSKVTEEHYLKDDENRRREAIRKMELK